MFQKIGFNQGKGTEKIVFVTLIRFISLCSENHISRLESTQIFIMCVLYLILTTYR